MVSYDLGSGNSEVVMICNVCNTGLKDTMLVGSLVL